MIIVEPYHIGSHFIQWQDTVTQGKGGKKWGRRTMNESIEMVGEMLVNYGRVVRLSEVFQQPLKLFKMIITSWNIRGLNNKGKQRYLKERLKKDKPKIMIVLETKISERKLKGLWNTLNPSIRSWPRMQFVALGDWIFFGILKKFGLNTRSASQEFYHINSETLAPKNGCCLQGSMGLISQEKEDLSYKSWKT